MRQCTAMMTLSMTTLPQTNSTPFAKTACAAGYIPLKFRGMQDALLPGWALPTALLFFSFLGRASMTFCLDSCMTSYPLFLSF